MKYYLNLHIPFLQMLHISDLQQVVDFQQKILIQQKKVDRHS